MVKEAVANKAFSAEDINKGLGQFMSGWLLHAAADDQRPKVPLGRWC